MGTNCSLLHQLLLGAHFILDTANAATSMSTFRLLAQVRDFTLKVRIEGAPDAPTRIGNERVVRGQLDSDRVFLLQHAAVYVDFSRTWFNRSATPLFCAGSASSTCGAFVPFLSP